MVRAGAVTDALEAIQIPHPSAQRRTLQPLEQIVTFLPYMAGVGHANKGPVGNVQQADHREPGIR